MIWTLAWVGFGLVASGSLGVLVAAIMASASRADEMAEHMAEKHDNDLGRWN